MRHCAMHFITAVLLCLFIPAVPLAARADQRSPQGVYAVIDISDYIKQHELKDKGDDEAFIKLYDQMLGNQAISGLALEVHWDWAQPQPPPAEPNWGYIDDAFDRAEAHKATIELIVTPGFNSPYWVFNLLLPCDLLFVTGAKGTASPYCGIVSFNWYAEKTDQDSFVHVLRLPLPWNSTYIAAWQAYLTALENRYGSKPHLVAIHMAGPTAASPEMIMPNDFNTCPPNTNGPCRQRNGWSAEAMWNVLFQNNPAQQYTINSDEAFIDTWEQTIDFYEGLFHDIALVITPGAGTGFPSFSSGRDFKPSAGNVLYDPECKYSATGGSTYIDGNYATRSCGAATAILTYFMNTLGGHKRDLMASNTAGMTASEAIALGVASKGDTGDVGVPGVKYLSWYSGFPGSGPRGVAGGAEFDHSFSGKSSVDKHEGCPPGHENCNIGPEQAAYNVLKSFFAGTAGAKTFNGPTHIAASVQPTPRFLEVFNQDVTYATDHKNHTPCIKDPDTGTTFNASAQQLLDAARMILYGQSVSFTPSKCSPSK